MTIQFGLNPNTRTPFDMHMLDSHAGTHLVPPAYALPAAGFDDETYAPEVQEWLAEYEKKYGRRGTSDMTTEKVPLAQTCGPARVIDVRHLLGTTDAKSWPASPEITVADIEKDEKQHGELQPGDIVIFHSGWSDRLLPAAARWARPAWKTRSTARAKAGRRRGRTRSSIWRSKGIRCVATDAPTLGGVEPKRALMTYWALGRQGNGRRRVPDATSARCRKQAYFLFAAVKIRGCHGGHGRAIALY